MRTLCGLAVILLLFGCTTNNKKNGANINTRPNTPDTACNYIVKPPYYLIQFNSGKYGIMKDEGVVKWYMVSDRSGHDFSDCLDSFTLQTDDSCSAKKELVSFISVRDSYKYKIIK